MKDDDSLLIKKETDEAKEILKDYLIKEQKKITRIPFYRLEEVKKIEEKKLKNIHKTEKKEKEKSNQLNHKKPLIERRKTKRTKKQRENLSSKHSKNNENTETSSLERSQSPNSFLIENQRFSFSNNSKNSNDITPIYLRKNNPNIMHDLKYSQSNVFPSKKEMRLSKKQQKLQNAENTIASFLTPENKIEIANLMKKNEDQNIYNNNINNNNNNNNKNFYFQKSFKRYIKYSKSDTKLSQVPFNPIFEPEEKNENNNEAYSDSAISSIDDENNISNNISLDEDKDIIEEKKEENEDEKSEEEKIKENNINEVKNTNEIKFGELKKNIKDYLNSKKQF